MKDKTRYEETLGPTEPNLEGYSWLRFTDSETRLEAKPKKKYVSGYLSKLSEAELGTRGHSLRIFYQQFSIEFFI